MTKKQLVKLFKEIREQYKGDEEAIHSEMDKSLLEYINHSEVTALFNADDKWYS